MRMAAPPDDGSPPWRLGTPHDSLNRLASLLGTFVLKESNENEQSFVKKSLVPKHSGLLKLVSKDTANDSAFSFPCLSLMTEDHAGVEGLDQNQVQAKAALSLQRSMRISSVPRNARETEPVEPNSILKSAQTATDEALKVEDVPTAMLNNLASSFSLLVDARLRAYTTILARHGVSLAASSPEVEQEAIGAVARKLENLADIGSRISIDNMVTNFQPQSKQGVSRTVDNVEEIMIPLVMSAVLDISVPYEIEGHERVMIPLQAAGAIVGSSDKGSKLLKSVRMELDTQQLMSAMVQKAAKVGSLALEHVNDSTCRHVAAAMLSLKTALPDKPPAQSDDIVLPVVSPDQISVLPLKRPTPLALDEEEEEDEEGEGPELTPECCASIVDDCIGAIGEDSLMLSPPTKKIRLEDSTSVPPAIL